MEDMLNLPNDARSKEVVRLWRAWRTVHEMVADRVRIRPLGLPQGRQRAARPSRSRDKASLQAFRQYNANISSFQEYELAEDEVNISLERFRNEYCNPDGSVKYAESALIY